MGNFVVSRLIEEDNSGDLNFCFIKGRLTVDMGVPLVV